MLEVKVAIMVNRRDLQVSFTYPLTRQGLRLDRLQRSGTYFPSSHVGGPRAAWTLERKGEGERRGSLSRGGQ